MYLVESSSGDLFLVQRFVDYDVDDDFQHTTDDFLVFKVLLQKINEKSWPEQVEVKSLGGDTLLGDNRSICVSASKWPGCQPNSIYYTDDYIDFKLHPLHGRHDIGIFNVENESFGMHYILDPYAALNLNCANHLGEIEYRSNFRSVFWSNKFTLKCVSVLICIKSSLHMGKHGLGKSPLSKRGRH
ncbi:uncharacterized protein LOC132280089 isoform X1 [Cornus florida]|uniref:uncharacterized protein LOC132280089 isoform X1 n=1 Tax=Cornus florida TaxID=4283 RepID=UPI00289B8973|nr:uncharacterized protein LOC132280089 isoform X1 [Cornus florida]